MQVSNRMYREGHLAIRAGAQIRRAITEVTGMVVQYVTQDLHDRAQPATAAKFRKLVDAAKTSVQHDSERKGERMFVLHLMSWCIQMCTKPPGAADTLQSRLAAPKHNVPANAELYTIIKNTGHALKDPSNCRTAKKFTEHLRAGLRDIRHGPTTAEVCPYIRLLCSAR